MLLGLRPEHITETRGHENGVVQEFTVKLDVVEPMGMETMVFFTSTAPRSAPASSPAHRRSPGETLRCTPIWTTCT